ASLILLSACARRSDVLAAEPRNLTVQPVGQSIGGREILATIQARGRESRANAKNLSAYSEIAALPATQEILTGLVGKISARLARLSTASNLVAAVGTPQVESVLNAMIEFDSAGELRRSPSGELAALIVLRTTDQDHARLVKKFESFVKGRANNALRISRTRNWTVLDLETREAKGRGSTGGLLEKADEFLRSTNWIDLTADLSKFGTKLQSSSGSISNQLHLTVIPQGDSFRSEIHITSDRPYELELGSWDIPLNTIRDPLIGFTAVQGIGSWLQKQPVLRTMGLEKAPNQAFFWSQPYSAFAVSGAVPNEAPRAAIDSIVTNYLPTLNSALTPLGVGTFQMSTNQGILMWRGLPIAVPYIRPAPDEHFLFGGLFPLANLGSKAPPAELMAQVTTRTNLLYYDWEITGERLNQWRQISQLISIVENRFNGDTNLLSERWLRNIQPKLGNCMTELSLTPPRERSFGRRSAIGFNSLELVSLARWLDPAYVKPSGKSASGKKSLVSPLPPN
ncbi:MAG: hypothetical protein JWM99_4981, partial [Verrucomicrobiales bacterium]|nr:hypothetical protein [Verrucomicrobiales bacterium]